MANTNKDKMIVAAKANATTIHTLDPSVNWEQYADMPEEQKLAAEQLHYRSYMHEIIDSSLVAKRQAEDGSTYVSSWQGWILKSKRYPSND